MSSVTNIHKTVIRLTGDAVQSTMKLGPGNASLLSTEQQIKLIHFRRFLRTAGITNGHQFAACLAEYQELDDCHTYDEDGIPCKKKAVCKR